MWNKYANIGGILDFTHRIAAMEEGGPGERSRWERWIRKAEGGILKRNVNKIGALYTTPRLWENTGSSQVVGSFGPEHSPSLEKNLPRACIPVVCFAYRCVPSNPCNLMKTFVYFNWQYYVKLWAAIMGGGAGGTCPPNIWKISHLLWFFTQ